MTREEATKAMGEELRKVRGGIKDKNTLIGYNMAIAIFNKYLSDHENTVQTMQSIDDKAIPIEETFEQELETSILDHVRAEVRAEISAEIRAEISEYGPLCVDYTIEGHSDKDIENIVENVLKQAKEQVLDILDNYRQESEDK